MSQEPQDQPNRVEQPVQGERSVVADTPTTGDANAAGSKTKVRKVVSEEAISPHPSIWPLALALALVVLLVGSVTQPLIMGLGALLVAIAIIGWGLERR